MNTRVMYNRLGGVQILCDKTFVIEDSNLMGDWIADAILEKAEREGWEIIKRPLQREDEEIIDLHPKCRPYTDKTKRLKKLSMGGIHLPDYPLGAPRCLYEPLCLDCNEPMEQCPC